MALSAKEQEIVNTIVLNAWTFVHCFVWPALVGGIVIGAVAEHFLKF